MIKKKNIIKNNVKKHNLKKNNFAKTNIKKRNQKKIVFKLKKKWSYWRGFKKFFLNKRKVTFYKKLQWQYNEKRYIWHQLSKLYSKKIKNLMNKNSKILEFKYHFLLSSLELRLPVILLRARFCIKIINGENEIKNNNILLNGFICNNIRLLLNLQDLFQKRRKKSTMLKNKEYLKKNNLPYNRPERLKWRKHRWKKARYIFWKVRRASSFNMYHNRKQNIIVNYLEINYKVPAGILIKYPFTKEIILSKNKKILTHALLKKIFFVY